jgi:hypothetical protein
MRPPPKDVPAIDRARSLAHGVKERAYALGRRSALARSIVARLRRMRSATLTQPNLIADEMTALIEFLRDSGCSFYSCTSLGANPKPLGISFRYDVHVRDIAACHAFVEVHRLHRIPATFYLWWDYSQLEHSYFGTFQELAGKIAAPLEIGLHDSPVDAYLIQSHFQGDRGAYWAWLETEDAIQWIASLAKDEDQLAQFNDAVLKSFIVRARQTQERFGPVSTVASHGGDLHQALHPRLNALGPDVAQIGRSLFAFGWLTPERVVAAGLKACVDHYGTSGGNWRQISDSGGAICRMVQRIQNAIGRNAAAQILLHPFTWDGAKRDGELRCLLATSQARRPSEPDAIQNA